MKKLAIFFLFCFSLIVLYGCEMSNTPTKKVENFLNNYKSLDEAVTSQMDEIVDSDSLMNDNERKLYKDVLRKQYQDITYQIKDEVINGDKAVVTAEIEVYDFYKITRDAAAYYSSNLDQFKDDDGNLDNYKYIDYRIEKLDQATDRVKYTIDFNLSKVDKIWTLEQIDDTTRQKIHGLYAY